MGLQRQGLLSPAPQQQTQAARSISSTAAGRTRSLARQRQGLYLCHRNSKVQLYLNTTSLVSVAAAAGTSILDRETVSLSSRRNSCLHYASSRGFLSSVSSKESKFGMAAAGTLSSSYQQQGLHLSITASGWTPLYLYHFNNKEFMSLSLDSSWRSLQQQRLFVSIAAAAGTSSMPRQQKGLHLFHGRSRDSVSSMTAARTLYLSQQRQGLYTSMLLPR